MASLPRLFVDTANPVQAPLKHLSGGGVPYGGGAMARGEVAHTALPEHAGPYLRLRALLGIGYEMYGIGAIVLVKIELVMKGKSVDPTEYPPGHAAKGEGADPAMSDETPAEQIEPAVPNLKRGRGRMQGEKSAAAPYESLKRIESQVGYALAVQVDGKRIEVPARERF